MKCEWCEKKVKMLVKVPAYGDMCWECKEALKVLQRLKKFEAHVHPRAVMFRKNIERTKKYRAEGRFGGKLESFTTHDEKTGPNNSEGSHSKEIDKETALMNDRGHYKADLQKAYARYEAVRVTEDDTLKLMKGTIRKTTKTRT